MAVALAEKQPTTLVGVLASSSGITLILASLASLLIVYSLVLFIRSFIGSQGPSRCQNGSSADGRGSGRRQLCENCSILHGGRSSKSGGGGQQSGENQPTDSYYPQQDPRQPGLVLGLTCSECSVGINKQGGDKNMRAFYGTSSNGNSQQHQIIFGKSKDSILVPELVCCSLAVPSSLSSSTKNLNYAQQGLGERHAESTTTTNGSNKLTLEKLQREGHNNEASNGITSINVKTVIEFANQDEDEEEATGSSQVAQGARFNDLADYNFSPITTRVLTDEKGHSIKIRIASPPPQRQRQLVQLHRRQFEDSIAAAAAAATSSAAVDRKRASCASDCPLISLGALSEMSQEHQQQQPDERDESVFEAGGSQQVSGEEGDSGASSGGQQNNCKIKRRHSLSGSQSKSKRRAAIGVQNEERVEQDYSGSEAAAAMVEAPIEAFNDSNTSEFDDVPGCDSRQDTSLDYQQPLNDASGACISIAQRRANEQVMDADLRQTNRLNLELALLQNTATQSMCLGGGVASKSASGNGQPANERNSLAHHNHHHLPQSGVLHLASELSNTMAGHYQQHESQQLQQRRKHLQGRQSSQDGYDSGCMQMGDESRRSSCFSGFERSGGSTTSSPSSLLDNNGFAHSVPSLRVEIRRLPPPPSRAKTTEVAPLSDRTSSNNSRPLSTKVALFYTMGISSLSRSKSLEDTDVAPCADGGGITTTKEPPQDQGDSEPDEDLYEISLVEANNVLKLGAGQSWAPAAKSGSSDEQGGRSSPGLSNNRRRSSLLGALGFGGGGGSSGAVSPGSQRRSSIDGVFVRVFKQAADGCTDSQQQYPQKKLQSFEQPDNNANACNVSLASYTGPSGGAPRPDFIQLPLVKLAAATTGGKQTGSGQEEQQQQQSAANTTINFQQLTKQGYKFTCSRHELPVRVSLYMVSKRGGARYTLGHCIIAPEDWHHLECRDRLETRQTASAGFYDERDEEEVVEEEEERGGGVLEDRPHDGQGRFWPSNKFVVTPGRGSGAGGAQSSCRGRVNTRRSLSSGASSSNNPFETISEGQEANGNEFEPKTSGEHDEDEEGDYDEETDQTGSQTGRQTNVWTLEYRLHQTILEAIKSY